MFLLPGGHVKSSAPHDDNLPLNRSKCHHDAHILKPTIMGFSHSQMRAHQHGVLTLQAPRSRGYYIGCSVPCSLVLALVGQRHIDGRLFGHNRGVLLDLVVYSNSKTGDENALLASQCLS